MTKQEAKQMGVTHLGKLAAALRGSEGMHTQMRGYLQSIASGELGPADVAAYLNNRSHESGVVSAIARAALVKVQS